MTLLETLTKHDACEEAMDWARSCSGSLEDAWRSCERGDWLLWIASKIGVEHKIVVSAACQVARTALKYVPEGELRPLRCIEVTEMWTCGLPTIDQVVAAAYAAASYARRGHDAAASYASYAAYAAASYAAADAAAYAAAVASYAADVAYAAADAAYAAAVASYAADVAYAATRAKSLAKSADIVREHIPWSLVLKAL